MTITRKYYAIPRQAGDDDAGVFITTPMVDLEHDRVLPEGADLTQYLRNPVVLWLHDSYGTTAAAGIPVGTTRGLEILPGRGIRATGIDWLEGDEFAARVKNAWDQGKVRGASVGFVPEEALPNEHGGMDYRRWRLLEWSLVPIPANPDAVRTIGGGDVRLAFKALGLDEELAPAMAKRLRARRVPATGATQAAEAPVAKPDPPRAEETEDAFLARCMADEAMLAEFPDEPQRAAVCHNLFDESKTRGRAPGRAGMIPVAAIERLCPPCGARLRRLGWQAISLKTLIERQMPPQLLDGLCASVDSFTACMEFDFGDFEPSDREVFCAWLEHECTGHWPGEKASVSADRLEGATTRIEQVATRLEAVTERKAHAPVTREAVIGAFRSLGQQRRPA